MKLLTAGITTLEQAKEIAETETAFSNLDGIGQATSGKIVEFLKNYTEESADPFEQSAATDAPDTVHMPDEPTHHEDDVQPEQQAPRTSPGGAAFSVRPPKQPVEEQRPNRFKADPYKYGR